MESFHSGWDYIPLGVLHIFLKPHIDPLSYKRRSRKEVPERGVVVIVVLVVLVGRGWWCWWRRAVHIAQCAVLAERWLCGILVIAVKTFSLGKTIFLRLLFLCCFRKKTIKLVSFFIFQHWNFFRTLKIGQNDPEKVFLLNEQAGTMIC